MSSSVANNNVITPHAIRQWNNFEVVSVCSSDPGDLTVTSKITGIALSFSLFTILFILMFLAVRRYGTPNVSQFVTADHASRLNSILHAAIIAPGLTIQLLNTQWSSQFMPLTSVSSIQCLFLFSIGYFLYDLLVCVHFRLPHWPAFAAHHIFAVIPYVIYLFACECQHGVFILAAFLLVEYCAITLNLQALLEEFGYGNTCWYALCLYSTFFSWIIFRITNLIILLYIIHTTILPLIDDWKCFLPSVISAWFITLFCIYVFFFILCKEIILRWKAAPNVEEVAELTHSVRPIKAPRRGFAPLRQDEYSVVSKDPGHMACQDTLEIMKEVESFASVKIMQNLSFGGRSDSSQQENGIELSTTNNNNKN